MLANKATLLTVRQIQVPYRTISGTGEPDSGIDVAVAPSLNSLGLRTTGGQLRVGEPVLTDAATTKNYVDNLNWFGTQAEYDAIPTKNPLTTYNIYEA